MSLPLPVEPDAAVETLRVNDTLKDGSVIVAPLVDHETHVSVVVRHRNRVVRVRTFDRGTTTHVTRWVAPTYAGSRESRHWED